MAPQYPDFFAVAKEATDYFGVLFPSTGTRDAMFGFAGSASELKQQHLQKGELKTWGFARSKIIQKMRHCLTN
jgi:hypothetical protein